MQGLLGFALSTVVKHLDVGTIWIFYKINKKTREMLEFRWKNLPFGFAVVTSVFLVVTSVFLVVTSVFLVVTFGLIVVGFTNGESGKTAKKQHISNSKFTHLSVLFKQLGMLGGQREIWKKKLTS